MLGIKKQKTEILLIFYIKIIYSGTMNIIYKVINIVFAIVFTIIIISILSNTEYFIISDTEFFRILSLITLISLWVTIIIKINCLLKLAFFLLFILYFTLYIAHPLL